MSETDELLTIARWLRSHAAELERQATVRRSAAAAMANATAEELRIAAQLATSSGRSLKPMSIRGARKSAETDSFIADRLEAEVVILTGWAMTIERISEPRRP